MKYIVFDISTQARQQLAYRCAQLLYKLQTPAWQEGYKTLYSHLIYQSGTWNGELFTPDHKWGAIAFDENEAIPLRTNNQDGTNDRNGYDHIRQWTEFRFPIGTQYELTQTQTDWLKQWVIDHNTATVEQLMLIDGGTIVNLPASPDWVTIRSQAEFDTLQWQQVR